MYVWNMECMRKMENSGHICSFMMIYRQKLELRFETLKKHPYTHAHEQIENDRVMEHNKKNDDMKEKRQQKHNGNEQNESEKRMTSK